MITDTRLKQARRLAALTFIKLAATICAAFVVLRVILPALVNAHDDGLAALGIVLGVLAPVGVGWAAVSVFISIRRFIHQSREG